jgi:endonuclease YncB( thermonuclease family)
VLENEYSMKLSRSTLFIFSFVTIVSISLIMPISNNANVLARCPNGYHKSPSGDCEKFIPHKAHSLPRCPNGTHRSPDGDCEAVNSSSKTKTKNNNTPDHSSITKTKTKTTKAKGCTKGFHKAAPVNNCVPNKAKQNESNVPIRTNSTTYSIECQGLADCFAGNVTKVVDGDTLDVNNVRIRLALVNTPEVNEPGYLEAKQFVELSCAVGSKANVDEDDGQKGGSFGRMIAKVYCSNNPVPLNELLLNSSHANIMPEFCGVSEFASNNWAIRHGC